MDTAQYSSLAAAQDNTSSGYDIIAATSADQSQPSAEETRLKYQLEQTRFVVLTVLVPIVILIGVTGNIMNICVLTRRWMHSSTNCYLTALAICDVLYLCFVFSILLNHFDPTLRQDVYYVTYQQLVAVPVSNTLSNSAVWLTLTFTVERYIGVCHPMKGKLWCTPHRAKYINFAVIFAAALLTFPNFFENQVVKTQVGNGTAYAVSVEPTAFGSHSVYKIGYSWFNHLLFAFVPFVLLFVFNIMLIHAVATASKRRQLMSGLHTSNNTHAQNDRTIRQQREQHKITMMLIVVVIVFLVCQIPQAVANIYLGYVYSKYGDQMPMTMRYRARILGSILNFLVIVNASINFVLYSSFSKKFRRTFRILFCRCCRDKNQPLPLIFSGVSNANDQTRTTRGTASPYTSSPVRHAHSCLSLNVNVNVTTPMPSPTVSVRSTHFIDRKSPRTNRNGYLAVNQMSKVV